MRAVVQLLRQSAEAWAAPHNPLHGFADGSSGCQRSGPECWCPNILKISSLTCPVSHVPSCSFNSEFLSVPLGPRLRAGDNGSSSGLVTAHGSFEGTTHRGSAEARRSSPGNCLSRSARAMSRMGRLGAGCRQGDHTAAPPASSEVVADRRACRWSLHPDVRVADRPERYRQHGALGAEYHFCRKCTGDIVSNRLHDQGREVAQRSLGAAVVPRASEPCAAWGRGQWLL